METLSRRHFIYTKQEFQLTSLESSLINIRQIMYIYIE